jgi:hypothetical protein
LRCQRARTLRVDGFAGAGSSHGHAKCPCRGPRRARPLRGPPLAKRGLATESNPEPCVAGGPARPAAGRSPARRRSTAPLQRRAGRGRRAILGGDRVHRVAARRRRPRYLQGLGAALGRGREGAIGAAARTAAAAPLAKAGSATTSLTRQARPIEAAGSQRLGQPPPLGRAPRARATPGTARRQDFAA